MKAPLGFIGLGSLGLPMATHLLAAGYDLTVYNRTAAKADPLLAQGARLATRPEEVITPGGIVISLLWDTAAVESIVTADGFLDRLGPGGIHISMCTGSPAAARHLAGLHAVRGSTYIEAPIFGRPEAAVAKKLWIAFTGPQDAKERVRPILTAMGAQGIYDFGTDPGAASTVKLAGNFLIMSAARSLVEALAMAENAGADPKAVVAMLTETLFTAPIYQSYGKLIAEKAVVVSQPEIPRKDLGLFKATAQQGHSPTPIADLLHQLLGGIPS